MVGGGLDFAELGEDIAVEVRVIAALDAEIATIEDRIEALYDEVDPAGIVRSAPGVGVTLAAGILGRTGDLRRFANLAGVRSFTGTVPKIDQSGLTHGHKGITKAGDPGLRQTLYLAADHARKVDPTLAARYHRLVVTDGKHHVSALNSIAAVLDDPHRRLLAQRPALRAQRPRRHPDHRHRRPGHLHRPLQVRPRRPSRPAPNQHRQTTQTADEPARKGVDQSRSGVRPVHHQPYRESRLKTP